MVIARKPKANQSQVKEQSIKVLIDKGGSAAEDDDGTKDSDNKPILIRIPVEALKKIDKIVGTKKIKMPRHTWLLEAIFEKLDRDD